MVDSSRNATHAEANGRTFTRGRMVIREDLEMQARGAARRLVQERSSQLLRLWK